MTTRKRKNKGMQKGMGAFGPSLLQPDSLSHEHLLSLKGKAEMSGLWCLQGGGIQILHLGVCQHVDLLAQEGELPSGNL